MSKHEAHILVVDDDEDVLTSAQLFLKQYFTKVLTLNMPTNLISVLKAEQIDLVLLDMNYRRADINGHEGLGWLQRILDYDPSIVVLPMTAYADIDLAVQAVKKGAVDFITKPWQNNKLLSTVSATLQLRKSREEVKGLKLEMQRLQAVLLNSFSDFVGNSPAILQVKETISKVAKTDANVLIYGENGVGKEIVARAIHHASNRAKKAFVNVDLGAIPSSLFESELFGVKKGAFTDAKADKIGRFEAANGGTLFLDEIGNIPFNQQAKLLGVLQNRAMQALGAASTSKIDVRLISATNALLQDQVAQGNFRQDLLFRLNTVEIEVPPLRKRVEDIPALAHHFLSIYTKKYGKESLGISPHAMKTLKEHLWPGNVRELQHAIERAVILSSGKSIQADDFAIGKRTVELNTETLNLEQMERHLVIKAVEKNRGNISQAAKDLGITRAALYRRLEKHGL